MSLPRALIERFVSHLAELQVEVAELEARLATPGGPVSNELEQLRSLSHKLAGTAGAYGFSELGSRALSLEQAITAATDVQPTVLDQLGKMREALSDAARSEQN